MKCSFRSHHFAATLLMIFGSLATAQQRPDAPSSIQQERKLESIRSAPSPQFREERVFDAKFALVMGVSIGGAALDVHSTRYCFNVNPRCYESGSPLLGKRPSAAVLTWSQAPALIGVNGLGYWLKKNKVKYWWIPAVAYGGLKAGFAVRNYRNAGR